MWALPMISAQRTRLKRLERFMSWKWETGKGDTVVGSVVIRSGSIVMYNVLESLTHVGSSKHFVFEYLCICVFSIWQEGLSYLISLTPLLITWWVIPALKFCVFLIVFVVLEDPWIEGVMSFSGNIWFSMSDLLMLWFIVDLQWLRFCCACRYSKRSSRT